ncbi:mechanosensitive ion channel domain-containing protein [Flavobacterium sp.]|uniref:mechanosensitive ion channel family protein n=1 Tax=Flavobacterium sp. TaxID=239 RepID=UPI0024884E11|nr:mechanosensitive ion channel domain-containing protein [Flavobacterium sp.]MDI1317147.1 mechanosensitive ion channel [Flavobacterium sp.]
MNEIFDYTLFNIDGFTLKIATFVKLFALLFVLIVILKIIRLSIYKSHRFDEPKKFSIYTLTKYVIIIFAFIYGLRVVGFDVSVLLAGSAALLVGFGLGMQNLFSDYISGLIILIDSSIKVGDILDIDGLICQVQEINLRTTTVFTRDDKYIILPNTDLTRKHLINWTHSEITSRFEIAVGVDYNSDVDHVIKIMLEVASTFDKIKKDPETFVRLKEFGDSSLDFGIFFWSDEIFRIEKIKSDYRIALFKAFNDNKISIPFPQRVIHSTNSL